jgi:hypothetical protein
MRDWSRRLLEGLLLLLVLLRQRMVLRQLWGNLLRWRHVVRHGGDFICVGEVVEVAAVAAARLGNVAVVETISRACRGNAG